MNNRATRTTDRREFLLALAVTVICAAVLVIVARCGDWVVRGAAVALAAGLALLVVEVWDL